MIVTAVLYYLACGDIEATIYDANNKCITVIDLDPKGASLIEWLYDNMADYKTEEHSRSDILEVQTLYF